MSGTCTCVLRTVARMLLLVLRMSTGQSRSTGQSMSTCQSRSTGQSMSQVNLAPQRIQDHVKSLTGSKVSYDMACKTSHRYHLLQWLSRCMERCQEPTQRAQKTVQQELQHVQDSLSRLTQCLLVLNSLNVPLGVFFSVKMK